MALLNTVRMVSMALCIVSAAASAQAAESDAAPAHAPFGTVRIVVPLTSNDPAVWGFRLHNLLNGFEAAKAGQGSVEAHVVLYGPGIKLLSQPIDPDLKRIVDDLRAAGTHFDLCNNTLHALHIDWHQLYGATAADVVPSGFLEVAWLGNHGWAVDPMN